MKKILTTFLLLTIAAPAWCETLDVKNVQIVDRNQNPIPGMTVKDNNSDNQVSTNSDGRFSITCTLEGDSCYFHVKKDNCEYTKLPWTKVDNNGTEYKTKRTVMTPLSGCVYSVKTSNTKSNSNSDSADTISVSGIVTDEDGEPFSGALVYVTSNNNINTTTDVDGRFKLTFDKSRGNKITVSSYSYKEQTLPASSNMSVKMELEGPGGLEIEETTTTTTNKCSLSDTLKKLNAKSAKFKETGKTVGTTKTKEQICIPTECESDKYVLINADTLSAKCVENQVGKKCPSDLLNLKYPDANPEKTFVSEIDKDGTPSACNVKDCQNGYIPNSDGSGCQSTACTPDDPNAASGKYESKDGKIVCVTDKCNSGFDLKNGKCEVRMVVSDEDMKKLKDNAQKMRENETSLENRTIGSAAIGATGAGGMMALSALSEQTADADAERAMRAYLETFRCDYGSGKNSRGGETNVELPGGNDMFNLYAQYAALANDLRLRKTALGMKPGIESEVVIDKAETGLYDDVGTGITGGAYASVARALMNPNGEDAKMWAAQKEKTAENLKTGLTTAGIGVAVGVLGNVALNSGESKKNKVNEILANVKLKPLVNALQTLEDNVSALPAVSQKCPDGADGAYPDCTCTNKNQYFNKEEVSCISCPDTNHIVNENNECKCPSDMAPDTNDPTKCSAVKPACTLTGDINADCTCMPNAQQNGNKCKCPYGVSDNKCADAPKSNKKLAAFELSADNLFAPSSSKLTNNAEDALNAFIRDAQGKASENQLNLESGTDYCLIIVGKTDRTQFKKGSSMNNQKLSENRANAVKNKLKSAFNEKNIKAYGIADKECTKAEYPKANDAQCRRVDISLIDSSCDSAESGQEESVNTTSVESVQPAVAQSTSQATEQVAQQKDTVAQQNTTNESQSNARVITNYDCYNFDDLKQNTTACMISKVRNIKDNSDKTLISNFLNESDNTGKVNRVKRLSTDYAGSVNEFVIEIEYNINQNDTDTFCSELEKKVCTNTDECRVMGNKQYKTCSLVRKRH